MTKAKKEAGKTKKKIPASQAKPSELVSNSQTPTVPIAIPASAPVPALPKIGCVAYLNAKPLWYALGSSAQYAHPVEIAKQLRRHEFDVANVPIMECLENPIYDLVDGIGVCCRGPVYSVILSHVMPFPEVRTIALDSASKTSAALIRVLVRTLLKHPITFLPTNERADAHLWIGDQAMTYRKDHPDEHFLDLGAAWHQMTRLPFVFAVWAMHRSDANKKTADFLRAAARQGIADRAKIAQTPEEYHYLTHNVRYELGVEEKRGIACFAENLRECGLISTLPTLNWI